MIINDKFRITDRIGIGAFNTVYAAQQSDQKQIRALKLTRSASTLHEQMLGTEFYQLSSLEHEHIVKVFGLEQVTSLSVASDKRLEDYPEFRIGALFIVMEYVDGAPLDQWVQAHHALDNEGALQARIGLLLQAASALVCLHRAGLRHGDVKPRNFMVTGEGNVKLIDLGISARLGLTDLKAENLGAPEFMAPEVWLDRRVDERSDQYAFGVVAYSLLYGKSPFESVLKNGACSLDQLLSSNPLFPPENTTVPNKVAAIIERMLNKQPGKRYRDMSQVIAAFCKVMPEVETKEFALSAQDTIQKPVIPPRFIARTHDSAALSINWEAEGQTPGLIVLEGQRGIGTSRLIKEIALQRLMKGRKQLLLDFRQPFEEKSYLRQIAEWYDLTLDITYEVLLQAIQEGGKEKPGLLLIDHLVEAPKRWQILIEMILHKTNQNAFSVILALTSDAQSPYSTIPISYPPPVKRIRLEPFTQAEAASLVAAFLGEEKIPTTIADPIAAAAGNVPKHIENIVSSLLAEGKLNRNQGQWRWSSDRPSKETLQTLAQQPSNSLVPRSRAEVEQKILEVLAISKISRSAETLTRLTNHCAQEIGEAIATLRNDSLLAVAVAPQEGLVYSLASPADALVILQTCQLLDRNSIHNDFANELLATLADSTDYNKILWLNYHLKAASRFNEAFTHCFKALFQTPNQSTPSPELLWEIALEAYHLIDEVRGAPQDSQKLALKVIELASVHQGPETTLNLLEEIEAKYQFIGSSLADYLLYKGKTLRELGDYETALACFTQIGAEKLSNDTVLSKATKEQAFTLFESGQTAQAIEILKSVVEKLQELTERDVPHETRYQKELAAALYDYGRYLLTDKRYDEAEKAFARVLKLNPSLTFAIKASLSQLAGRQGDFDKAVKLLSQAQKLTLLPIQQVHLLLIQANLAILQRRYPEAYSLANTAMIDALAIGNRQLQLSALKNLSLICSYRGDNSAAKDYCLMAKAKAAEALTPKTKDELDLILGLADARINPTQTSARLQELVARIKPDRRLFDTLAYAHSLISNALPLPDNQTEAERALIQALDLLEKLDQPPPLTIDTAEAWHHAGIAAARLGNPHLIRTCLTRLRDYLQRFNQLPVYVDYLVKLLSTVQHAAVAFRLILLEHLFQAKSILERQGEIARSKTIENVIELFFQKGFVDSFFAARIKKLGAESQLQGVTVTQTVYEFLRLLRVAADCEQQGLKLFSQRGELSQPYWLIPESTAQGQISETVMNKVKTSKQVFLSNEVLTDPQLKERPSICKSQLQSILCVPLNNPQNPNQQPLGAVYLADTRPGYEFTPETVAIVKSMTTEFEPFIRSCTPKPLPRYVDYHEADGARLVVLNNGPMHLIIQECEKIASYLRLQSDQHQKSDKSSNPLPPMKSILITGESGVGKEVIARYLHYFVFGNDLKHPFIAVNCGGFSNDRTAIRSELFGHVKGAFTDAKSDREGAFYHAQQGTIFLDEIGTMPLEVQAALLRVLDTRRYHRLGEITPSERATNAWVIAATNEKLEQKCSRNEFRRDLLFRLATLCLEIPPLRYRKQEIEILANFFLDQEATAYGRPVHYLAPEALQKLQQHSFPGNIRELRNCLENAMVRSKTMTLTPDDLTFFQLDTIDQLQAALDSALTPLLQGTLAEAKTRIEKLYLTARMKQYQGKVDAFVAETGKSKVHLTRLLKQYDLKAKNFR